MMGEHKKHILLNTYSGDVIVNDLPANLQFGLYIEIYAAKNGQDTVKMELLLNDKVLLDGQADMMGEKAGHLAVLTMPSFFVNIDRDATLAVRITQENMMPTVALKKRLSKGQIPT